MRRTSRAARVSARNIRDRDAERAWRVCAPDTGSQATLGAHLQSRERWHRVPTCEYGRLRNGSDVGVRSVCVGTPDTAMAEATACRTPPRPCNRLTFSDHRLARLARARVQPEWNSGPVGDGRPSTARYIANTLPAVAGDTACVLFAPDTRVPGCISDNRCGCSGIERRRWCRGRSPVGRACASSR